MKIICGLLLGVALAGCKNAENIAVYTPAETKEAWRVPAPEEDARVWIIDYPDKKVRCVYALRWVGADSYAMHCLVIPQ